MKNGKMKNDRQRTFMLITIPVVGSVFLFQYISASARCILQFYKFQRLWFLRFRRAEKLYRSVRRCQSGQLVSVYRQVRGCLHDSCQCHQSSSCTGAEQQDQGKECTSWYLLYSQHPGRSGCRLYFQLLLYLYPAVCGTGAWNRSTEQQYAFQ